MPAPGVDGRLRDTKLERAFGESNMHDESVARLVHLGLLREWRAAA
jgi:hypothetical protein